MLIDEPMKMTTFRMPARLAKAARRRARMIRVTFSDAMRELVEAWVAGKLPKIPSEDGVEAEAREKAKEE